MTYRATLRITADSLSLSVPLSSHRRKLTWADLAEVAAAQLRADGYSLASLPVVCTVSVGSRSQRFVVEPAADC